MVNELPPNTFPSPFWFDSDSVQPPTVAIVTGYNRADDCPIVFGNEEQLLLNRHLLLNDLSRCIMRRIIRENIFPELLHSVTISDFEWSDVHTFHTTPANKLRIKLALIKSSPINFIRIFFLLFINPDS